MATLAMAGELGPSHTVFRCRSGMSLELFVNADLMPDVFRMVVFLREALSSLERWENLERWKNLPDISCGESAAGEDYEPRSTQCQTLCFSRCRRHSMLVSACLQNLIIGSGFLQLCRVKDSEAYWTSGR